MPSQEYRDSLFIPQDSRENFKNVIAKRSDLLRFAGGRIVKAGAGLTVTYEAGLVLGYATSGADAGFYKPYSNAATDGSQTAVGVLAESAITDDAGNGSEISIIKSGELYQDLLIGLDGPAIVDLNAKASVEHGSNLLQIYG